MTIRLALAGAMALVATSASAQDPPGVDVPPVVPIKPAKPLPPDAEAPLEGSLDTPGLTTCAPAQLFKATIRNTSPGLAAADRGAQPRQLWRQGDRFLRSEESPDPARGDMTIVIIAEPDIWTYNQATRQGRHATDPGPQLTVRAPILPPVPGLPAAMQSLEFGCEPAFVAAYAPQALQSVPWGSIQAAVHTATMGEHQVAILMDTRRNAPLIVSYLYRGQPRVVIRYDEYRQGLPDRPQLFQPPKGIRIQEAGQEPAPRPLGPS
ncbi:hypothetical protein [Phenylobacterium sp.]|uniref:hypothetical protein n=1 Tax=Phenylobacterium sp. TaxID=1871053 RepID=UPI0025D27142|nr:hypothetical protein [Phenylobacterium sp.]MBX3484002.1 hypothetical protein [Phenylobacterium sp.]MCW5760123.1 hypothetical protein [Phenylobacterium sp.]